MLSICINAKNGARYLERVLASLTKFEDVVLLDNYSTDETIDIAKKFLNVRIFQCEFNGMGYVRNIAASYAINDWVLFVDCDEVLDRGLVDTLLAFKFENGNIYNLYRKNYYNNLSVEFSSWGNDWIKRLYNKKDTRFANNQVHDNFIDNLPNIKIYGGFIYHFPYENVSELVNKMQFYSTLFAKQHFNSKFPSIMTILFRTIFTFFKSYVIKRGLFNGYEGLLISGYNAIGVFFKYSKLYELYNRQNIAVAVEVHNQEELQNLIININKQNLLPECVFILVNSIELKNLFQTLLLESVVAIKIINKQNNVLKDLKSELYLNSHIKFIKLCEDSCVFANYNYLKEIRFNTANGLENDVLISDYNASCNR